MAGYHEHFVRRASAAQRRHLSDDALLVHIKAIHATTRSGYGWPRTWKELLARGIRSWQGARAKDDAAARHQGPWKENDCHVLKDPPAGSS